jgi:hypothetical protein
MHDEYSSGDMPMRGDTVQHYVDLDEGVVTDVRPGCVTVNWTVEEGENTHYASELSLIRRA